MNLSTIFFYAKIIQKKKKAKYARNNKILKGGENCHFKLNNLVLGKLRLWKKEQ